MTVTVEVILEAKVTVPLLGSLCSSLFDVPMRWVLRCDASAVAWPQHQLPPSELPTRSIDNLEIMSAEPMPTSVG